MPPPAPGTGRLGWTDLPAALRDDLTGTLGAQVTEVTTPKGGFGHQFAATLTADNGRQAFVKASADDDPLAIANLHESHALSTLPAAAPAPDLLGIHRSAGWTAVVIEHLDGPQPDLSPDSTDPARIWALLEKLTADPAPAAYTAAVTTGPSSTTALLHGWDELTPADLPRESRALLPLFTDLERSWPLLARGDRIVHGDLRADNMVADRVRGVTFVDWAHATTGPACIDAISLAPQLILAGADPADVARAMDGHPATAADPVAATAFLAALTGHWHLNARRPAPPRAPGLRSYQQRAAAAGVALLTHRLS